MHPGWRETSALSSRAKARDLAGAFPEPAHEIPRSVRDDNAPPLRRSTALRLCLRCNFPVAARASGCKNPCPNCGTVYPLGDCSD
jgi:hypothetical protein